MSTESRDSTLVAKGWYLDGIRDGQPWLVPLVKFPFVIGRLASCDLFLSAAEISRRHAVIDATADGIFIHDCDSVNGTFVNQRRIYGGQALQAGDLLHFGSFSFRLYHQSPGSAGMERVAIGHDGAVAVPAHRFTERADELQPKQAVEPFSPALVFQPVVAGNGLRLIGYEWLGYIPVAGDARDPALWLELTRLLEKKQEDVLLKSTGENTTALWLPYNELKIFFNIAPAEIQQDSLCRALPQWREMIPELPLVMEIDAAVAAGTSKMLELKAALHDWGMQLAYDHFGIQKMDALESITVAPDFLKFDVSLIHRIDQYPVKQQALADMITAARNLGIATLAEGTETHAEVTTCIALGFDYLQGFYFGESPPDFTATTLLVRS